MTTRTIISTNWQAGPGTQPPQPAHRRSWLIPGAAGSLLVQVGGMGAAFGCQLGLAHMLGVGAFGQFAYIISWVNLLAIISRCGSDQALMRFIPKYRARDDRARLRGIVRVSTQTGVILPCVLAVPAVAGLTFVFRSDPDTLLRCLLGAALLIVLSVQGIFTAQLRALKHVVLGQLPRHILSPAAVVGLTYTAMWATGSPDASTALAACVAANIVLMFAFGSIARRRLRSAFGSTAPQYDRQVWRSCSLSLLVIAVVQLISLKVDVLMVGGIRGMAAAGIYTVATQLAGLSLLGLLAVNAIAAPMISELYAKGRSSEFGRFLHQAAWGICIVTLPVAAGLIAAGKVLLGCFGPDFVAAYPAFVILVSGHAAGALLGPVGFVVTMTGHQREASWIFGGGAVLNVVLNLLWIPRYGLPGAAAATTAAILCWKLVMVVFILKRLKVNPTILPNAVIPGGLSVEVRTAKEQRS